MKHMTVGEIIQTLQATVVCGGDNADTPVLTACAADLMSDVLTMSKARAILLTGLSTIQVVYTAEMSDISIVCFVRGKKPHQETIALARARNMTLLTTDLPMFESCGRLYKNGLKGCSEQ